MTRVPALVLAVALLGGDAANAAPVRWTLPGTTFGDGAVATGSFVFDAGPGETHGTAVPEAAALLLLAAGLYAFRHRRLTLARRG